MACARFVPRSKPDARPALASPVEGQHTQSAEKWTAVGTSCDMPTDTRRISGKGPEGRPAPCEIDATDSPD